jgi:hypothetical protein
VVSRWEKALDVDQLKIALGAPDAPPPTSVAIDAPSAP